jgi:hypothetical protein
MHALSLAPRSELSKERNLEKSNAPYSVFLSKKKRNSLLARVNKLNRGVLLEQDHGSFHLSAQLS